MASTRWSLGVTRMLTAQEQRAVITALHDNKELRYVVRTTAGISKKRWKSFNDQQKIAALVQFDQQGMLYAHANLQARARKAALANAEDLKQVRTLRKEKKSS